MKTRDAAVNVDKCLNWQRHCAVLSAIARLSCCFLLYTVLMQIITVSQKMRPHYKWLWLRHAENRRQKMESIYGAGSWVAGRFITGRFNTVGSSCGRFITRSIQHRSIRHKNCYIHFLFSCNRLQYIVQ